LRQGEVEGLKHLLVQLLGRGAGALHGELDDHLVVGQLAANARLEVQRRPGQRDRRRGGQREPDEGAAQGADQAARGMGGQRSGVAAKALHDGSRSRLEDRRSMIARAFTRRRKQMSSYSRTWTWLDGKWLEG